MPISDEMVEAAARALYAKHLDRTRGGFGRRLMPTWDNALPETRDIYLTDARAALEAAEAVREREVAAVPERKCTICEGPFDNDFGTDICRMCEQAAEWREPFASTPPSAKPIMSPPDLDSDEEAFS